MASKNYSLLGSKDVDVIDDDLDFGFIPKKSRDGGLFDLPVKRVRPDKNQPRTTVEESELDALEQQILATKGITKPIDVYEDPDDEGFYIIEDGEQRWTIYSRNEWELIPCRLINKAPKDSSEITLRQLLANIGRIDMTLLDVAKGMDDWRRKRAEEEGADKPLPNKRVAQAFGWSATKVSRTLKLLDAPDVIKEETKKNTNINTLNYMLSVYKVDPMTFEQCMEWYQSDSFQENPEKYWLGVHRELSGSSKTNEATDVIGIKEDRSVGSLRDPASSEDRDVQTKGDRRSEEQSQDERSSSEKPLHREGESESGGELTQAFNLLKGKDGSIVSSSVGMNGGVAVLQLSVLPPGANVNAFEEGNTSEVQERLYQFDTVAELDQLLCALEKAKKGLLNG